MDWINELSDLVAHLSAPKWVGGGGITAAALIIYQFWNTWRKNKIELLQIRIAQEQKHEENEMTEFQAMLAALRQQLEDVRTQLKEAYAQNDALRRIHNEDRDLWNKERAKYEERNSILSSQNAGLIADKMALRAQIEQLQTGR